MPTEPLVDVGVVHRLWLAGLLTRQNHRQAVLVARDAHAWRRWAQVTLLVVAVAHLLSAVAFFFAFNWAELSAEVKLATVQVGIVLAALASRLPLPAPAREALLIAASALVGVLLAVFGQVFQTGADAWQLFTGWALLTLPWTLAAGAAAHWALWLVVAQLGVGLFLATEIKPWSNAPMLTMAAIGAPALVLLGLRELLAPRLHWLRPRWARLFAMTAGLGPPWAMATFTAIGTWNWESSAAAAAFMTATALVGLLARRDLAAVALATLFVCGYLSAALVSQSGLDDDGFDLILAALEVVAIFGLGSALLHRLHHRELAHV